MIKGPLLIIFAGLPGTGKTTLARELSDRLGATYLRIDSIEQAMIRSTLAIHQAEDAGYEVGYALAEDNLRLGRTVVADSVNMWDVTRNAWRDVAQRTAARFIEVEVICSDEKEHKKRVETRVADIKGHKVPTWAEVIDRDCEPWDRDHIVVDTVNRSIDRCLADVLEDFPVGEVEPILSKEHTY